MVGIGGGPVKKIIAHIATMADVRAMSFTVHGFIHIFCLGEGGGGCTSSYHIFTIMGAWPSTTSETDLVAPDTQFVSA